MIKKKNKISPVMTFALLIFVTIVMSGFLHFINFQAEYSTVNPVTNEFVNNVVEINNLFSFSGIKHIITSTIKGFVNFEPLAMLIIVLIGIGVLEKSGFLKTFITIITRNAKKNSVTFVLILICLLSSFVGNIGFVLMLPLGALLFKYGRRNPLGGIIAAFASLSIGYGINIFLSGNDSSLLTLTLSAARTIDSKYTIDVFYSLFLMVVCTIVVATMFTNITEKVIMPKLSRYEYEEEVKITNKELRGLIVSCGVGFLYFLLVVYMIIPNLPLSGAFLDHSASSYVDMLFGANSLFSQGFVFIITMWFVLIGLAYGFVTKTFKNNKDIADGLGYSLDGIGKIIVLLFVASLFINVYEESNIGILITAFISTLISKLTFNGVLLIIISFILIAISNLFCPSSLVKWKIISSSMVPVFINSSISPEFANVVYNLADGLTNSITPLLMYFVIYIAFLEKYSKGDDEVSLFGSYKYMVNYTFIAFAIFFILIVGWYMIGIPIGIGTFPGISYGA